MREDELRRSIQELEDKAADRAFTEDERDAWNELNGQLDEFEKRNQRILELARSSRHTEVVGQGEPRTTSREAFDDGLRAIERHRSILSSEAGDRLEELVRGNDPQNLGARYLAAVANPHYREAFGKMVADPTTGHLRFSAEEVEAVRVVSQVELMRGMVEGTGSAGGFGVPFDLDPSILLSSAGVVNPFRELARRETISVETWKGVSSDGVTAAFSAEAAEVADGTPTLAQPTISAEKAHCFVPFSIELGQDWPSLQRELARLFNDAKNTLEATKLLLGTGTNEPGGILNIGGTGGLTTSQRIQTDVAATLDIDDVWDLKGNLANSRFYANSTFVGNPGMFDRVYRFTPAGSTTEPQAMPDRGGPLMGRPVAELSTMVNTTTTGSKVLILGDWSNFRIVDRIGGTVELVPHLMGASRRPTGERGLYYYWRVGSGVTVAGGFRYLEVL